MTGQDVVQPASLFAVLAERENGKQAVELGLSFQRLFDEILVPYEQGQPFFVDGVPFPKQADVGVLKVVQQTDHFMREVERLRLKLVKGRLQPGSYRAQLFDVATACGDDVTNRVTRAYRQEVAPNIKRWIQDHQKLLEAAINAFAAMQG